VTHLRNLIMKSLVIAGGTHAHHIQSRRLAPAMPRWCGLSSLVSPIPPDIFLISQLSWSRFPTRLLPLFLVEKTHPTRVPVHVATLGLCLTSSPAFRSSRSAPLCCYTTLLMKPSTGCLCVRLFKLARGRSAATI
jgi:hypothetical protein